MKLIKDLDKFTRNDLDNLINCIEERIYFEEDREPESDGTVHDNWDDRISELNDILDLLVEANDYDDDEAFAEAIGQIREFQFSYGGLSRLNV